MSEPAQSPSAKRLQEHPVHGTLQQWWDKVRSERPENFKTLEPEQRNAYVRLRWVLRETRARLDNLDPFFAQQAVLDSIRKHITALQGPWDQYRNDPKQQWQALDAHAEGLLSYTRNLPKADGSIAWKEIIEELRADMDAAIKEAQTAIETLQSTAAGTDKKFQEANEKLQELQTEIKAQKARLDQMLTQQSETFSKAEQDRVAQFTKAEQDRAQKFGQAQDEKKTQYDALVAEINKTKSESVTQHKQAMQENSEAFKKAQDKRKTQHDALIAEFTKAKSELFEQHKADLAKLTKDSTDKSSETLAKIHEQLDKAVEIVGTIVKTTMSGTYKEIANREYRNAMIMRWVAIGCFLIMGVMVITAVWAMHLGQNGIDWPSFLIRLSFGFVFLIPGWFCAKESGRHWASEKQNRKISLEMATLDPFLVKLDEAKRKEVIEKMAREYFGAKSPQDDGEEGASLSDLHFSGKQLAVIAHEIVKILKAK